MHCTLTIISYHSLLTGRGPICKGKMLLLDTGAGRGIVCAEDTSISVLPFYVTYHRDHVEMNDRIFITYRCSVIPDSAFICRIIFCKTVSAGPSLNTYGVVPSSLKAYVLKTRVTVPDLDIRGWKPV